MAYGQKISLARKAWGYSQEALAERCGVSRQAVSRWEQEAAYPETEKLILLSRVLDLSLDELLLGGRAGGAKPSSCGKLKMPRAESEAFQGVLIKESLQNDAVLDLVELCGVELWQTQGAPRYWTAITFVSHCGDLPAQVQKSLAGGGWFADMKRGNIKFIVFPDEILQYEIGNLAQRQAVRDACQQKGIPPEQMNWPE